MALLEKRLKVGDDRSVLGRSQERKVTKRAWAIKSAEILGKLGKAVQGDVPPKMKLQREQVSCRLNRSSVEGSIGLIRRPVDVDFEPIQSVRNHDR